MSKKLLDYLKPTGDFKRYILNIQNFNDDEEDDENLEDDKKDNDDEESKEDDDSKNIITMSTKTLNKRLERERKKTEKEYEKKLDDILSQKMQDFSQRFFQEQKEKEELSKLSEKERSERELKNKLAEYERKEKELEKERKELSRFKKENELIETFRQEKIPMVDEFIPIAKILSKLDDDDRNDAYLAVVDFLRNGIEKTVKSKFQNKEPESSNKNKDKKEGYGSRFAKNHGDLVQNKNSDFSSWGK